MSFVYFLLFLATGSAWAYISFAHESRGESGPWFVLRRSLSVSTVAFLIATNGVRNLSELLMCFVFAFFAVGLSIYCWNKFIDFFAGGDSGHLRGQSLWTSEQVTREIKKARVDTRLELGGVPIPVSVEDRGFLLAGSPGTGKSQAIMSSLDILQAAGHRAVLADASGIFYSRYADNRSALFNPYDSRSVKWSPLADIRSPEDAASVARSIVPDGVGEGAEWSGYAQSLLEAVLEYVSDRNGTTGDVLRLSTVASAEELRNILPPGPVHALLDKDAAKMLASVRAIVGSKMKSFSALDQAVGADGFSIRDFISEQNGWLFVSFKQSQRDALRPLIAATLDIASRAVLDLPPAAGSRSDQTRTWFVLDELPLLGRISSLVTLLTNGSKHGASAIVGLQTVAQLRETYGQHQAQTVLATLGTWLTLRVSDPETADYMSRNIGDEEIRRVVSSGGTSSKSLEFGSQTSENWGEQYTTQRVVLPSELQNLPDLCGYLNIAGPVPACPIRLSLAEQRLPVAEAFVQAERKRPTAVALEAPSEADLPFPEPEQSESKSAEFRLD